jgi:acetyl-CoA carboxylase biotin carboxyl carrier protein
LLNITVYNGYICGYTYPSLIIMLGKGAAMAKENNDLQKIKELIEIMKANDLLEVEIKHGEDKIFLKRTGPQQPAVAAVPIVAPVVSAPLGAADAVGLTAAKATAENLVEIKSPLVGIFYSAPSPDSRPYVEIGTQVEPAVVVCVIEAMKVMNEIKAEMNGTVTEILVTNGQAVEYGQVLFRVRPN